jgi:prolyl oligopeptidase
MTASHGACATEPDADPWLWLEDVHGERALAWVRERNAESQAVLETQADFAPTRAALLEVLNASERIPAVTRRGALFYNLWQDAANPRGLWRRTTLAEYRKAQPAWETVLDLDALGAAEGENWVWGGASCLGPDYRHCMISLSRGGADASVRREFDCAAKAFVANGFTLAEAKSEVEWIDADTLYVATDFGPGSLTASGYPRIIKRWRRGTALADAVVAFEAEPGDAWAAVSVDHTPGYERTLFTRAIDFFHSKTFLLQGEQLVPLDIPDDSSVSFMRDTLLLQIRSDWQPGATRFEAGSLLVADASSYLRGEPRMRALFTPTPTRSLAGFTLTRDHVLLSVLDNVTGRLEQWHKRGGEFRGGAIDAPSPGTLSVTGLHDPLLAEDPLAEHYLLVFTDFLTPDTLYLASTTRDTARERLKSAPAWFDATGMHTEQCFASSRDGTRIPYFIVWPEGTDAATPGDGSLPTLLYGYGGFEIALQPAYAPAFGRAWHARGGVRVVANIRGGGEFGPAWHRSAQREHKQRSYDDFIAVAEDLIARKITRPRRLGIRGGSNGGLLVGAVFTQRPELFNAVVCAVPLLDMRRFHMMLAGASWMAEYGNPDDPDDWAFISRYSPYQNVRPGTTYPPVFFNTSTRDDRVHPGHARKMAAKMAAQGHPVLYYENIEGGHGGAADNEQRAQLLALEFAYLWRQLGRPETD